MKYKEFDSEEFKQICGAIKEVEVAGGGFKINDGSVSNAVNYFNQKKMPEFGSLIRLAYDYYFGENVAKKILYLENGEVKSKEAKQVEELAKLSSFTEEANSLTGITLNLPVIGEIVSGLLVIFNVIGIFSNEPKTRSFNMKDKLIKKYEAYNRYKSLPAGSMERNTMRTVGIALRTLANGRPKCSANTDLCNLEHLRFELRGDLALNASTSFLEITSEFFNDENFKTFINDYQLIVNVALPEVIKGELIKEPVVLQDEKKSGSILPFVAGAIGLYALNKYGGS